MSGKGKSPEQTVQKNVLLTNYSTKWDINLHVIQHQPSVTVSMSYMLLVNTEKLQCLTFPFCYPSIKCQSVQT